MGRQLFHYQLVVDVKECCNHVLQVYTDKIGLITDRIDADKKADAASEQLEVVVKKLPTKNGSLRSNRNASNKDVS